jgi:hypothetical protein
VAKLNESNFLEWKENMMGLLMAKKLWHLVEKERSPKVKGGSAEEKSKGDKDDDDLLDQQAKGFIWINIEHQQRSHVPANANAHQTWKALCTKHEQVGPQVIANCVFGLTTVRYVDGTKMEDHLAKMKEYFTRLDAVNCQLPPTVKAVLILASLSPSWTVFKQTQTAAASDTNPLSVSSVSLAVLQERDRRLNEERASQSLLDSASALAATQAPDPRRDRRGPREDKSHLLCQWCGRRRHEERECWAKRDGRPQTYFGGRANAASSAPYSDHVVFTAASTAPEAGIWFVDSAASNHYCHEAHLMNAIVKCDRPPILSANGASVPVTGYGSVDIRVPPVSRGRPDLRITVTDVSYVPGLTTNLLSVGRLAAAGLDIHFPARGDQCVMRRGRQVIAVADRVDGSNLYRLRTVGAGTAPGPATATAPLVCLAAGEQADLPLSVLWHQRLGHINPAAVATLLKGGLTADVQQSVSGAPAHCDACTYGKLHRTAVLSSNKASRATRPLSRLHLDICGPFSAPAHNGDQYLLQIVDDYSRYVWASSMPNRESATVLALLRQFVTMAEAMHSGHRVSILRSDNGPELVSAPVSAWLLARGIQRERTATYSPHQNGVVERMNRSVVELGRTILIAAALPPTFWALAMDVAVYCRNRSPTTSLDDRTPYEAWHGKKPAIAHMRVFGCLAFVHIR